MFTTAAMVPVKNLLCVVQKTSMSQVEIADFNKEQEKIHFKLGTFDYVGFNCNVFGCCNTVITYFRF